MLTLLHEVIILKNLNVLRAGYELCAPVKYLNYKKYISILSWEPLICSEVVLKLCTNKTMCQGACQTGR